MVPFNSGANPSRVGADLVDQGYPTSNQYPIIKTEPNQHNFSTGQQPPIENSHPSSSASCLDLPNSNSVSKYECLENRNLPPLTGANSSNPSSGYIADELTSACVPGDGVNQSNYGCVIPAAHNSDHRQHPPENNYSQPTAKILQLDSNQSSSSSSSSSNMALNFTHDLSHHQQSIDSNHRSQLNATDQLLQQHHQLQPQQHQQQHLSQHHSSTTENFKVNQLSNSLELDQTGCLAPSSSSVASVASGVNMNMWKNSLALNNFKHPSVDPNHNNFSSTEFNTYPWAHGNTHFVHQAAAASSAISHHHHMIGYPHHQQHNQRSSLGALTQSHELVVGPSCSSQKDQTSSVGQQQAAFILSPSITASATNQHQVPPNSSAVSSNLGASNQQLQQPQQLTNSLRAHHQLGSSSSYNLPDNHQLYGSATSSSSSRPDSRSHLNIINRTSNFSMNERFVHMSLGAAAVAGVGLVSNHPNQIQAYQSIVDHMQPGSSSHQHHHHMAAGSSVPKPAGCFKCNTCNETFALRNAYQAHLKTHHSQDKESKAKFYCELCQHKFSQKTSLNRHMKSHTGERPFPCETCGKAFSEKERLKIHMRTHTGEKPFSCGICGKSFSQKSTVKRHQTVHTGEKKFRCHCGKGFANRGNLIAHIKTRGPDHCE